MREKKKDNIPWWAMKYPFASDEKKPALIKTEDEIYSIYGFGPNKINVRLSCSTDKILTSIWIVPPGQCFEPADIHSGDEPYYILKGVATIINPETGQVIEAKAGDAVLIPAQCWHQTYNFTDEDMELIVFIEGKPWDTKDMELVESLTLKQIYYKGES